MSNVISYVLVDTSQTPIKVTASDIAVPGNSSKKINFLMKGATEEDPAPAGYTFLGETDTPPYGLDIEENTTDPGAPKNPKKPEDEFPVDEMKLKSADELEVKDKNDEGWYNYTITVKDSDGKLIESDPVIRNRNG